MKRRTPRSEFVGSAQLLLDKGRAANHRFLEQFRKEHIDFEGLRFFAIQWFLTARAHRLAFPFLIAAIEDEAVRFDLVCILYEEYGQGNRSELHVDLLAQFLLPFGITKEAALNHEPISEVSNFHARLRETWQSGDATAFGLQYGLEYLAQSMQVCFAQGLLKYDYIHARARAYFDLHAEAEVRHVSETENGLDYFLEKNNGHARLMSGVQLADTLLASVWDGMHAEIFTSTNKAALGD